MDFKRNYLIIKEKKESNDMNYTTETTTFRTNLANELNVLARGNDLEALLNHSAKDLRDNPTLENMLHVQELISIIINK